MTIKDAARELNVEAHVLRYWEEELGLDIKRNDMGHRAYSDRDIRMFRRIMELKDQGLSLKDIRDGISEHKNQDEENKVRRVSLSNVTDAEEKIDNCREENRDEIKVVDFKTAQLQSVMNKLVANALRENKGIITSSIRAEITEDVMKQMDVIISEKEQREEERFRKLDEVLRKLQQSNEEVAATRIKGGLFRKRRK